MNRQCIEHDHFLCNSCVNRSSEAAQECPSRWFFGHFGDKWTLPVLGALFHRPMRFSELRNSLEPVSERMLIRALKKLESFKLICRTQAAESPHQACYRPTADGEALLKELTDLYHWTLENGPAVLAAYEAFRDTPEWTDPASQRRQSPPENQL